jgi:hypothetical protein
VRDLKKAKLLSCRIVEGKALKDEVDFLQMINIVDTLTVSYNTAQSLLVKYYFFRSSTIESPRQTPPRIWK